MHIKYADCRSRADSVYFPGWEMHLWVGLLI
ncbi:hypothetical protein TH47_19875 [Thalassospira sp. MCCC 1A02803]|nr:hypothetical protein TH47_19875 [Thalassospira sp. MCCC 1A02803]